MAIFMNIDGATGSATAKGYEGWTEIHGISFGATRHISIQPGREVTCNKGPLYFSSVNLSFNQDAVSTGVWTYLCKGSVIPKIEIQVCHADTSLQAYLKLILENVHVERHFTHIVSGGLPHEQITLHCKQITRSDIITNDSKTKVQQAVGFNVGTQTML